MFQVICPECGETRQVKARKLWMTGEPPYQKLCKRCCQVGKEKSEEHKSKLSVAVSALQTKELRKKKSEFMKLHPEIWRSHLIPGKGAAWNKGTQTGPMDEETKQKISESMKERKSE